MSFKETIDAASVGVFIKVARVEEGGGLFFRKYVDGGVALFWRALVNGKSVREQVGWYDPSVHPKSREAAPGKRWSIAGAMAECRRLAALNSTEEGGLTGMRERELAAADALAKHSLQALMDVYVEELERLKKPRTTVLDARGVFRKHVAAKFPDVAAAPAREFTPDQLTDILRVVKASTPVGRQANKLRSYIGSAFEKAVMARSDHTIGVGFKDFNLTINPVRSTKRDKKADRSAKNAMTLAELRAHFKALQREKGPRAALCRLHILLGGQRMQQLVRLRGEDVNLEDGYIRLWDTKGRDATPREHLIPLTDMAEESLKEWKISKAGYVFSIDDGETAIGGQTLADWHCELQPLKDGEPLIEGFMAKRIRSAVETALSDQKVNKERRGRLLSHGVRTLQDIHYDDADHMVDKLDILLLMEKLLVSGDESKPMTLRERRAAAAAAAAAITKAAATTN